MPRIKTQPEDWLRVGIRLFSNGGEEAVNIEKMARMLKCSKGSFYWRFKTRTEFLSRLLERWREISTEEFIARAEEGGTPGESLKRLLLEIMRARGARDFDFYLRRLSFRNKKAARVLGEIEERRLGYMKALMKKSGMEEREAGEKSDVLYHYYLGWYERNKKRSPEEGAILDQIHILGELLHLPLD